MIKRKIVYSLIAIIAFLLVINVLLGITEKKKEVVENKTVSREQIEEIFLSTLNSFGLEQSWMTQHKVKKKQFDSLTHRYRIKLPIDVAIPVVLKDLNESYNDLEVLLTSKEKKKHGFTEFMVISNTLVKLIAEFKYQDDLIRSHSTICFLVNNYEKATQEEQNKMAKLSFPVGIILPLEEDSRNVAENLKKSDFEYFIELSEDSDNNSFELNEDLELPKLAKNITTIISSFNSPKVFFNNPVEKIDPRILEFVSQKFAQRGRKVVSLANFISLQGENEDDLISLLDFHLNKLNVGEIKIFRINIIDWFQIQEKLNDFVKSGNKIEDPSKYLILQ